MDNTVCRAITFINYNIPIRNGEDEWEDFEEFYTTGFFDCMYTKRISCDYPKDQLKNLWDYSIECVAKGDGRYAHQNIFCFSQDEWNGNLTDADFWNSEKYSDMLLTFVVFVQTRDYITDVDGVEKQCKNFNAVVREQLQNNGYVYTYGTVDKNDFVVCIRSRCYKDTVNAIMKLHETECSVVYSYSVFGISRKRQRIITDAEYEELNKEKIDSISLKGVTNSTRAEGSIIYKLDVKYYNFCKEFVKELYKGEPEEENKQPDYKIYDILGDNDFRLICRLVPLGNLIRQIGEDGLLNYGGDAAQYTFFSTHLVLNTQDLTKQSQIQTLDKEEIVEGNSRQKEQYRTVRCSKLKAEMDHIRQWLKREHGEEQCIERLIAAFHGAYQLLQSITALESAPTKKYDFYSMYYPLAALVDIMGKLFDDDVQIEKLEKFAGNEYLYDFVHKISMTLHGTLRTDIQFFQIRDFNVTVHYAPAKLRAYYTFFVFMLSAHIREVSAEANRHSYIFCPGMFKDISVRQLSNKPEQEERLLLITVPERYLYFPKNLSIILTHEVGHMAGDEIRRREQRHNSMMKCGHRILQIEITKFINEWTKEKEYLKDEDIAELDLPFEDELLEVLRRVDRQLAEKEEDKRCIYYSKYSLKRIQTSYRIVKERYGFVYWNKYGSALKAAYQECMEKKRGQEYRGLASKVRRIFLDCEALILELDRFFDLYSLIALPHILEVIHYIMSESISDILAVLILGLGPSEYVYQMADETKTDKIKGQLNEGISKVRIALVISVIGCLRKEFCENEQINGLLSPWLAVDQGEIPGLFRGTTVYSLMVAAVDYLNECNDKKQNADKYKCLYDYQKRAFNKKVYDFFNDKKIYQYMFEYLLECGREYITQLSANPRYMCSKKIVSSSFRRCIAGTPIDLMEQIDVFLKRFEDEWKDEYMEICCRQE